MNHAHQCWSYIATSLGIKELIYSLVLNLVPDKGCLYHTLHLTIDRRIFGVSTTGY